MSGYQKIRELCKEARARAEDATAAPWSLPNEAAASGNATFIDGIWSGENRVIDAESAGTGIIGYAADFRFIVAARSSVPRLARLLEAALEVVAKAEYMTREHACYGYDDGTIPPLEEALSSFRSLAEQEGGGA